MRAPCVARIDHALLKINVEVEAKGAGKKSRDVLGDGSAMTKWHQVPERSGEARGQIDRFPEINYL